MLTIRFLRQGRKHQPFFKIVVIEKSRSPKSGKFVEEVGFWNPLTKEKRLKKERILYWLSKGAGLSDVVHNLLVKEGIIKGKKIAVHSSKKKKEKSEEAGKEKAEEKKESSESS